MEFTEEKLYEAFGLKPEEGENDPEPAEQEPETPPEDDRLPEEDSQEEENQAEEEDEPEEPEEEQKEGPGQSKEERQANAARRREKERQEAIDAAVKEALEKRDAEEKARMDAFFKEAGIVNPYTKKPITNMEEFNAWAAKRKDQKLQDELKSGKLSRETLDELIEQNPAVQAARQREQEAAQAEQQRKEQELKADVERQLSEIRKEDPSVKTIQDLVNRPYSKALYEAVRRGNNLVDAFYLATRKQKDQAIAEAARQSALNNLEGKKHLRTTSPRSNGGADVSQEEEQMFRVFNPKATKEEIQKYMNKYSREKGEK